MTFGSEVQPWSDDSWAQSLGSNNTQSVNSVGFDRAMTPSSPFHAVDQCSSQYNSNFVRGNLYTTQNNYQIPQTSTDAMLLPLPPLSDSFSEHSQLETRNPPSPDTTALDDEHISPHSDKPKFTCNHEGCQRTFKNDYTYRVHSRVHIKREKKRFECETCKESFSRRHDMMRHEVRLPAPYSEVYFVDAHMQVSQHNKVPEWTCHRCRRFFSSKVMLEDHKCAKTPRGVFPGH